MPFAALSLLCLDCWDLLSLDSLSGAVGVGQIEHSNKSLSKN